MKFELSLATVLVFLVPGGIVLLDLVVASPVAIQMLRNQLKNLDSVDLLVILISSFLLGALVDMCRPALVDWIVDCLPPKKARGDYLKDLDKEGRLEVFHTLLDNTQVYYRLNANTLLALILLLVASKIGGCLGSQTVILAVVTGIVAFRTYKSRKETDWTFRQFSK